MKVYLSSWRNKLFKLQVCVSDVKPADRPVLAVGSHYEGTSCWTLEDLRLYPNLGLECKQYFGNNAEDFHSHIVVKTDHDRTIVKSLINEYQVTESEKETLYEWCTYRGIVPGRTAA